MPDLSNIQLRELFEDNPQLALLEILLSIRHGLIELREDIEKLRRSLFYEGK